jgi:hypothetical protein
MSLNVLGDQTEDDGVSETRRAHWKTRTVHSILIGKSHMEMLCERHRRSWRDLIHSSQGRVRNKLTNLEILCKPDYQRYCQLLEQELCCF